MPMQAGMAFAQQDDFSAGPNDAGRIAVGETVAGHLERPGDVDWFAVELEAGVAYAFDQEGADTSQGTLPDPLLTLLDSDGNPIGGDDDGGSGLNARLLLTPEEAGRYYIAAGAYGDATGTYRVTVLEYPGFEDDVGDTSEQARGIAVGEPVTGALEVPGDTDLFEAMVELHDVDVALLPIWGWGPTLGPGHLDPERAAAATELIAPRLVVPIHWGTYAPENVRRLPGRWFDRPIDRFTVALARRGRLDRLRPLEPGESVAVWTP